MRVVVFGTYDTRTHPRVAVLRDGLAQLGFDVAEVNAPLGVGTAERVALLSRPGRLPRLLAAIAVSWARLVRARLRSGSADAVVVGYLGHFDVHLARLLYPTAVLVLDYLVSGAATAQDRAAGGRGVRRVVAALDAAALRRADLVVVDTLEHADALPRRHRRHAVVVPVGATMDWFTAGGSRQSDTAGDRAARSAGPLSVVFFGLYTPLQGAPVIAAALARLPPGTVRATMIGSGQDLDAARRAAAGADVRWLPWVDAADLPALVAGHDVCLGIFGTTPKARLVVPTKLYQGAAAGCALVTSDTPPQARATAGAAVLVPPGDPEALAAVLRDLAADPDRLRRLRAAARARAEAAFTPARVTAALATAIRKRTAA